MILEGIITTAGNSPEKPNIAAMGVTLDPASDFNSNGHLRRFQLKPFEGSRTFANLKERSEGVFHLVDHAELLARAALSKVNDAPTIKALHASAPVLAQAISAYEFQVIRADWSQPRALLDCEVIAVHSLKSWRGWNRAQNAVLELTILATRAHMISENEIRSQMESLRPLVEKTAGPEEWSGWNFVVDYLENFWKQPK